LTAHAFFLWLSNLGSGLTPDVSVLCIRRHRQPDLIGGLRVPDNLAQTGMAGDGSDLMLGTSGLRQLPCGGALSTIQNLP
jgi:hypothetical protein